MDINTPSNIPPPSTPPPPNFISFLDTYKEKNVDFDELAKLISNINGEYIKGGYSSPYFSGKTKHNLHSVTPASYYSYYDGINATPTVFSFTIHSHGYNTKKCNSRCIPCSGVGGNKTGANHTMKTISLEPSIQYFTYMKPEMGSGGIFMPFCGEMQQYQPPKERRNIDAKIETIVDILDIINKYPVCDDIEYNIDIESLAKIKGELEELNTMVGMKELKTAVVNQLLYFMQELHIHPDGKTELGDYKHTVLYGQPGTGKTEIAKIIGRMYSKIGILKKSIFKKVTRNDLVAGYLGQTAIKTKGVITECLGGVLFIDEAYALTNSNELDSFSKECVDTLCEALSDHKHELMVIVAGYEEDMDTQFFQANKGLESRFIWRFKIDKYNAEELMAIFLKKVGEAGWKVCEKCVIDVRWFEKNMAKFKHCGRDMEQLFFYTKICHSKRVYGMSAEHKRTIDYSDIEQGMKMFLNNQKKDEKSDAIRKIMETLYI